jgi:arylsulfatase A-like enzyme
LGGREVPPDIVVFLADGLGRADCSPSGRQGIRTPNMARLATDGMTSTHAAAAVVGRHHTRPAEEPSHLDFDPWERDNLASDTEHAQTLAGPRSDLNAWMAGGGDLGLETERRLPEPRARKGAAK